MQKKDAALIGLLVVLGGIWVVFFSHWFDKRVIDIEASFRPDRRAKTPSILVGFSLNGEYELTSLKIVPMEGGKVNPQSTPAWNLISDSNSVPTRAFRYGYPIRGMKPALKGIHAEPLAPGGKYRVTVSTKELTGTRDFTMPSFN